MSGFLTSSCWFALALLPVAPSLQDVPATDQAAPVATSTPEPTPVPTPAADPDADKPVVPDAEFDKALPPLSDDINAPLEVIPTTLPAVQATQGTAAAPPATAADDDTLTPPAPQDGELVQPLAPLATFNATPPAEVADVKDDKAAEIRYDTQLKGLDSIGLEGQFEGLSVLKDGGGKAVNATMVSARAKEDEALAVRLMKSKGYYDGTAISTIEIVPGSAGPNNPGRVRAIVSATPGPLYKLSTVNVQTGQTVPPDLVRIELPLKIGDPIEADRVQGAEANVAFKLPQMGYPFVKVGDRDILLDDAAFTGDYTLPVDTGPRSSFGGFKTTTSLEPADAAADAAKKKKKNRKRKRAPNEPVFDLDHIALLARFKQGELYDDRKVDDLRKALVATSLFSTVSVEPVQTGTPGPDGTEAVDLLVRQRAGPFRSLAATGGYSTGEGFKVTGSFTHRNLFPPEGALIITGVGGTQEQGLGVSFRRSNAGQRDRTFTLTASADHSNYDAFNAFTGTLSAKVSYDSTPIWQKRFTYAYGLDLIGTNESVYDFAIGDRRRGSYFIAALPGHAAWDTSDDLLNPTRGYRIKLNLSPETSVRGSISPYFRTMVEVTGYYPVGNFVIAGRARAGGIFGIARDDLAPSRRYYGGGGGSVRGYGYQRLGPFDPNGDPVGGRSLNEFSIEARYRFGNFGIVPFFDAGNSYESSLPKASDLRYGAGIGGRFYTNFGPLRFDVATPLNRRKGDGRVAVYISIGQAF